MFPCVPRMSTHHIHSPIIEEYLILCSILRIYVPRFSDLLTLPPSVPLAQSSDAKPRNTSWTCIRIHTSSTSDDKPHKSSCVRLFVGRGGYACHGVLRTNWRHGHAQCAAGRRDLPRRDSCCACKVTPTEEGGNQGQSSISIGVMSVDVPLGLADPMGRMSSEVPIESCSDCK